MNSDSLYPVSPASKLRSFAAVLSGGLSLNLVLLSIAIVGCSTAPKNTETSVQLSVPPTRSAASCVEPTKDAARARAMKEMRPLSFYDASVPYPKRLADSLKWFLIEPPSGPPSRDSVVEADLTIRPNGDIASWQIKKVAGSPDWETAVTRALKKADKVPLDATCNAPPSRLVMTFNP